MVHYMRTFFVIDIISLLPLGNCTLHCRRGVITSVPVPHCRPGRSGVQLDLAQTSSCRVTTPRRLLDWHEYRGCFACCD